MINRDVEALLQSISEIESEARKIKREREEVNQKVLQLANERNVFNEQVKELIKTAKEEREKRDHCNKVIAELKTMKEQLENELKAFYEQAGKLEQLLEERKGKSNLSGNLKKDDTLRSSKGKSTARFIRKKVEELEWKLQTTSLTIEEEREIVDQISRLEQKFNDVRKIDVVARDLRTLQKRINVLEGKKRSIERDLQYKVRESRYHHKTMIQAFKNADILRKQADELHLNFISAKNEAKAIHGRYLSCIREISRMRSIVNQKRQKLRDAQEAERKERLEEKVDDAKKKFEKGQKLSFDEFRTLVDQGLI